MTTRRLIPSANWKSASELRANLPPNGAVFYIKLRAFDYFILTNQRTSSHVHDLLGYTGRSAYLSTKHKSHTPILCCFCRAGNPQAIHELTASSLHISAQRSINRRIQSQLNQFRSFSRPSFYLSVPTRKRFGSPKPQSLCVRGQAKVHCDADVTILMDRPFSPTHQSSFLLGKQKCPAHLTSCTAAERQDSHETYRKLLQTPGVRFTSD